MLVTILCLLLGIASGSLTIYLAIQPRMTRAAVASGGITATLAVFLALKELSAWYLR